MLSHLFNIGSKTEFKEYILVVYKKHVQFFLGIHQNMLSKT